MSLEGEETQTVYCAVIYPNAINQSTSSNRKVCLTSDMVMIGKIFAVKTLPSDCVGHHSLKIY